jgi:hypothetical protein
MPLTQVCLWWLLCNQGIRHELDGHTCSTKNSEQSIKFTSPRFFVVDEKAMFQIISSGIYLVQIGGFLNSSPFLQISFAEGQTGWTTQDIVPRTLDLDRGNGQMPKLEGDAALDLSFVKGSKRTSNSRT